MVSSVQDLYDHNNVENWRRYQPDIAQYYTQDPSSVAAGHKTIDVYQTFCYARSFLGDLEVDNYGQLIGNTDIIHLSFIRSKFLVSSLAFYNYCIDLSWQVPWLYYGPSSFGLIYRDKEYTRATSNCTLESVRLRLYLARDFKTLSFLTEFFGDDLTQEVRQKYNYLKHRGSFHYDRLGMQPNTLGISVNGNVHKMLTRETLDIEEWKLKLIEFDVAFATYFETLTSMVIPHSYFPSGDIDIVSSAVNHERRVQEYFSTIQ